MKTELYDQLGLYLHCCCIMELIILYENAAVFEFYGLWKPPNKWSCWRHFSTCVFKWPCHFRVLATYSSTRIQLTSSGQWRKCKNYCGRLFLVDFLKVIEMTVVDIQYNVNSDIFWIPLLSFWPLIKFKNTWYI